MINVNKVMNYTDFLKNKNEGKSMYSDLRTFIRTIKINQGTQVSNPVSVSTLRTFLLNKTGISEDRYIDKHAIEDRMFIGDAIESKDYSKFHLIQGHPQFVVPSK